MMRKLLIFLIALHSISPSSEDLETCEAWFNAALNSLSDSHQDFSKYEIKNCRQHGPRTTFALELKDKSLCSATIENGAFIKNNDPSDIFGRLKKLHQRI